MIWVLITFIASTSLAAERNLVPRENVWIEATAFTNGHFDEVWEVRVNSQGAGVLDSYNFRKGKIHQREFALTAAQISSIQQAIDAARFAELPKSLSPKYISIEGPGQRLYIRCGGKVHRVSMLEPEEVSGPEVDRFRQVWRALVDVVPIPPPGS